MRDESSASIFGASRSSFPVVLTIAGSDSGGGAGIQVDLKTFAALQVFGVSAIACITAQNPDAVTGVEPVSPDMVALQIRTVCDGFPIAAAKTGMLYSADIIRVVARTVTERRIPNLVVDPVMVATSGARLLREDAVEALCSDLIPKATVVTPNVSEAEILCGHKIGSVKELEQAAREIGEKFGVACVAKGGHLENAECRMPNAECGEDVINVLFCDGKMTVFSCSKVKAVETHGTGCAFSAALAALLGRGEPLPEAVRKAGEFVADALRNAVSAGSHHPINPAPPVCPGFPSPSDH